MTRTPDQAEYAVQMLIRDWLIIDGTMDNHIQSAIDGALEDESDDLDEDSDAGEDDPDDVDSDDEDEVGWDDDPDDGWTARDLIPKSPVATLGATIRQAGWDQIPGWPRDPEGFKTWPAPGQTATMVLSGAQWDLVLSALHCWAAVDDDMDDAEGAARSRAIAAAVKGQLVVQGWSPLADGSS